ncbi:MAG: SET domain-containing protein [Candidatus Micrarchaeota archaeon]|nr:SET domain-containing protein [Candidatus Micrarchaeota archaeon]
MANDILVRESKIHGNGVFANRDFAKGEVVLRWDVSHVLTPKQVEELPEDEKKYASVIEGRYILLQPPERRVNHSCEANTFVKSCCDVARRDIKKGEEITADYGEEDIPGIKNMKCNCGSKNCRRIIRK